MVAAEFVHASVACHLRNRDNFFVMNSSK